MTVTNQTSSPLANVHNSNRVWRANSVHEAKGRRNVRVI